MGAQPVISVYIFFTLKIFPPAVNVTLAGTGDEGVLSSWRLLSSYSASEAEEWTQFMRCFLHKHKDQASAPRTHVKVRCSGMAFTPSAGDADAGGFPGLAGQPIEPKLVSFDLKGKTLLTKIRWRGETKDLWGWHLASRPQAHKCMHAHTCTWNRTNYCKNGNWYFKKRSLKEFNSNTFSYP